MVQLKGQHIGIKSHGCLQRQTEDLNVLPSPFPWWVVCAVLGYHDQHAEAGSRASWSQCLSTQELHEGLIPWTAATSCLGFFRSAANGSSAVFYRKVTLGGKWAKMAKEEYCYPPWSINEVSSLMVCPPHPLRTPLCHLLVSLSQLRSSSKASTLSTQGCFTWSRKRRNTGRFILAQLLFNSTASNEKEQDGSGSVLRDTV